MLAFKRILTPARNCVWRWLFLPWLIGLLAGYVYFTTIPVNVFFLMRSLFFSRVSIFGVLISLLLPVSAAAVLLKFRRYYFVAVLVFLKAALYGFTRCAVSAAFGQAAWLFRFFFLMPGNIASFVFLVFLYLTFMSENGKPIYYKMSVMVLMGIGFLDFFVLSPVCATLGN